MKWRVSTVVIGVVIATAAMLAMAKDKPAGSNMKRQADQTEIRDASQAFARAFEQGDAKTIANFWTEEGEYINEEGATVRGREALAKAYAGFLLKRQHIKAEAKTEGVRFLGKDIAVEDGVFTVRASDSPSVSSRYSTLYVRQDGHWLMALLKEQADRSVEKPVLDDLGWLVGTWQSEGDEAQARITYEWADNKRFLKANYSIKPKKAEMKATTGTEMIGIDPALGVVRGWTFDDAGDFGETFWKWDNGRWAIEAGGTHGDGSHSTALNLLTRSGDNAFTWRSVKRTLDGHELPDLPAIKVTRVQEKDRSEAR